LRLFTAPHTLGGLFLIGISVYLPLLILLGDDVPGQITNLQTTTSKKSGLIYHAQYSYVVDGFSFSEDDTIDSAEYAHLKKGQPCTVRVFRFLPKTLPQRLGSSSPWLKWPKYLVMALFWNAFMSLIVWCVWIDPWRKWMLLKYGTAVAGQVKSRETYRGSKGGTYYRVHYVYVPAIDDAGMVSESELLNGKMSVSFRDYNSATTGKVVTVLFSPNKPRRSIVYDFAEYEAIAC
jgi:hypothetical protein